MPMTRAPRARAQPAIPAAGAAVSKYALLLGLALSSGACSLIVDFDSAAPDYPADECAFGEPNDTPATATPLPAEPVAAALCHPDLDYYTLTIPAGRLSTRVDLRFTQSGAQGNLDLRLFDAEDRLRASSLSADSDEQLRCPGTSCEELAPGDYLLEVREALTSTAGNRYQLEITAR
jgi:hypothetical protein